MQGTRSDQPAELQALNRCQSIASADRRLDCYDVAVASLLKSAKEGALVVVDREAIRKSRRTLFGLSLPNLPFLGSADRSDEMTELHATIQSARETDYSKWLITLQDGAVWQTTEPDTRSRTPRSGDAV